MTSEEMLAATEARRFGIEEAFGASFQEEDAEDIETEDLEQEADEKGPQGLSESALDRFLELATRPNPAPARPDDSEANDDDNLDGGATGRVARRVDVAVQFEKAIREYRDGYSAPRGLDQAFRRRSRGPRVFDVPGF